MLKTLNKVESERRNLLVLGKHNEIRSNPQTSQDSNRYICNHLSRQGYSIVIPIVTVCVLGSIILSMIYVLSTPDSSTVHSMITPCSSSSTFNSASNKSIHSTHNSSHVHYTREFSDQQLRDIFDRYVTKPQGYLSEYQWISNDSWWKPHCSQVFYMSRAVECTEFHRLMTQVFNLTHFRKCLSINSISDPEWKHIHCDHQTDLKYQKNKAQDNPGDAYLLNLPDKGEYDFFLANQMFEHFYDPSLVMQRINEHLIDGGYVWVTVPIINVPHMTPVHFYHLQPMALATLAISNGFRILELGWWGTPAYLTAIFKEKRWPNVYYYRKYEPMINQWRYAAQTWALLQKVKQPRQ